MLHESRAGVMYLIAPHLRSQQSPELVSCMSDGTLRVHRSSEGAGQPWEQVVSGRTAANVQCMVRGVVSLWLVCCSRLEQHSKQGQLARKHILQS